MVPFAAEAARWTLVHAVDLPGFGLSGNPETILGISGLADATAAWMTANDLPPAIVLGNSVGSQIAVDLAARHPEQAAGIVLTGLALGGQRRSSLSQVVRALADAPREPVRLWPMQIQDFVRAGPRRVLQTYRMALKYRIEKALPRVTAPTLVVEGTNDPMDDREWNRVLIRQLAQGRHAVVEGGTHALPMTRPVALSALVREFAEEIAAPSS
jgi:pimeloyl-ACP methyl ester carboxylesterase